MIDLIACSICLRVQRGPEWVDAEDVIREIRSYELAELPRLHGVVCEDCGQTIDRRRAEAHEEALAA